MTHADMLAAVQAGDLQKVKTLLAADATLANARGERGERAVLLAIYFRRQEVLDALLASGAEFDVFEAAASGDRKRLTDLLDRHPSSLDGYSADGWSPLHLAAHFGHADLVDLLVARGAQVAAVSKNGTTNMPLHAALAGGKEDAAGRLLRHGADPNAAGAAGWRPLHLAAANGLREAVSLLLDRGADPNVANDEGRTPLALALEKGRTEIVSLFRERGARR